jgi:succinate dehydrogenase / fumarate reductase iron-sulfur subunit
MRLKLKIWRQKDTKTAGKFVNYDVDDVSPDMSFLEMLDILNLKLVAKGEDAIEFDHDCREGICGSCALTINGDPHGPETGTATCQLHMRHYKDGDNITIEPFRARSFPVIKDLSTDRRALDRIIAAGGFISVNTGNAPEANGILIGKDTAEAAMDAAACIGCGACVASCKNASAMLFVSAKVTHLALLPQGNPERKMRVRGMVSQMDAEGFGGCSNTGACEAACPKEIKLETIATLNRELIRSKLCRGE